MTVPNNLDGLFWQVIFRSPLFKKGPHCEGPFLLDLSGSVSPTIREFLVGLIDLEGFGLEPVQLRAGFSVVPQDPLESLVLPGILDLPI